MNLITSTKFIKHAWKKNICSLYLYIFWLFFIMHLLSPQAIFWKYSYYYIQGWGWRYSSRGNMPPTPTIYKVTYYLLHFSARSEIYIQAVFHRHHYLNSKFCCHSVISCYKIQSWGWWYHGQGILSPTPNMYKVIYYLLHSWVRSEAYMQAVFHSHHC